MTVFLRDAMTVEEFLAAGCIKKGLSPVEHFIRVKKRRDMPNLNYFVPHRSDLIETYVRPRRFIKLFPNFFAAALDTRGGGGVRQDLVPGGARQEHPGHHVGLLRGGRAGGEQ